MSIFLKSQKIIKDWIDYNGHMNVAYYVLIFDEASEGMLNKFKMGAIDAKANNRSTMVVESRITYNNEVKENEEVDVYCNFFDHDKKRLIVRYEMYEKETKKLARQQKDIRRTKRAAKSDGKVTKKERAVIHSKQNAASRNIKRKKNNDRNRK